MIKLYTVYISITRKNYLLRGSFLVFDFIQLYVKVQHSENLKIVNSCIISEFI